jgi:hypothetical protein
LHKICGKSLAICFYYEKSAYLAQSATTGIKRQGVSLALQQKFYLTMFHEPFFGHFTNGKWSYIDDREVFDFA